MSRVRAVQQPIIVKDLQIIYNIYSNFPRVTAIPGVLEFL
jgi:hypothetical protein